MAIYMLEIQMKIFRKIALIFQRLRGRWNSWWQPSFVMAPAVSGGAQTMEFAPQYDYVPKKPQMPVLQAPVIQPEEQPKQETYQKPVRRKYTKRDKSTSEFRRDILDQLDKYFTYLKRMRRTDPQAYSFYKKIGSPFTNMSESDLISKRNLEPFFLKELPSFGSLSLLNESDDEYIPVRFVYFRKYATVPFNVQQPHPSATVYSCTAYHDEESFELLKKWKTGTSTEFFVAVYPDGRVQVLLQLLNETQVIVHKDSGYKEISHIEKQRWGISTKLLYWAAEHKTPPAQYISEMFVLFANLWCAKSIKSMIRIEARKDSIAALITVDVLDIPTFFKDRNITVTVKGRRAPIFHIVRPHVRTMRDGTKKGIAAHFSGLRQFAWNGYAVRITVPGKDHHDFNLTGKLPAHDGDTLDMERLNSNRKYMEQDEMAEFLMKHVDESIENSIKK